ncbi:macro domain-containing protein [Acanthopleuribacter pedis]|uniref:Macro domain-containing protein n=1 Tax=Acanthopleuribacter pedis TaxID=442870 RepID=A0A8J7QD27_9BACT|nr:macro domain-containing protein [Acanthopleuribacter pedis]MBO1321559.1 macro domain-containing protein [Acanthopleuribacter pedis]
MASTPSQTPISLIQGELLDQSVDAIVNPWQRHWFPGGRLCSQHLTHSIRQWAGDDPYTERDSQGPFKPGDAVATRAGRLPHRAIIHFAADSRFQRADRNSVDRCLRNALDLAGRKGFNSIAIPLLNSDGWNEDQAVDHVRERCSQAGYNGRVILVKERK